MLTGEVAARMHITSGTVTSLLDNLERKRYVVRSSDRDDRRRVLVDITPAAQAVLDEALPAIQQVTRQLIDRIGAQRQQALLDILDGSRQAVADLPDDHLHPNRDDGPDRLTRGLHLPASMTRRQNLRWRRWDSNPRPPACKAGALAS